jgi:hypothetical protein
MARVRQARKSWAHRRDGQSCGSYAIEGGYVCRMHGGASPRARYAAYCRDFEGDFRHKFEREYACWQWSWWHGRPGGS